MGNFGEGKIQIPLEDFWSFVENYHDHKNCELVYGMPRTDKNNNVIEINYAFGFGSNPCDWSEKPKCLKEWEK